jgi:hypothetical protein
MSEQTGCFSKNEYELDEASGSDFRLTLENGPYEEKCPQCEMKPEEWNDWLTNAGTEEKANFDIIEPAFQPPRHCINHHWWIPCSSKVYSERQMAAMMIQKKKAGNPLTMGRYDFHSEQRIITDQERKFFAKNEWKLVSLTREEYFGSYALNRKIYETAMEEINKKSKQIRKLRALTKKLKDEMKTSKSLKGGKGRPRKLS